MNRFIQESESLLANKNGGSHLLEIFASEVFMNEIG